MLRDASIILAIVYTFVYTTVMNTHNITTVGLKEFRANVAKIAHKARTSGQHVVVTSHNKPLFKITPLGEEAYTDGLLQAVQTGEADAAAGRVYSEAEVVQSLHE